MARKTKIERAFEMYNKNMAKYGKANVQKIADKLGISVRTVRGYVYRMRHPDRYKAAVQRYLHRKAEAKADAKAKAEATKASKARKTKKQK